MRQLAGCLLLLALAGAGNLARAQQQQDAQKPAPAQQDSAPAPQPLPTPVEAAGPPASSPWLDRLHRGTYDIVWRSAMRIDRMFGSKYDERAYQQITGSVAPALLWDEFGGYDTRFRFNINLPLPRMNERFNAFVGRVDPEEYISERSQQSGAFHRQYGPRSTDETLLGISYVEPRKEGIRFDAGTGIRLRSSPDPYVKGGLVYEKGSMDGVLFGW